MTLKRKTVFLSVRDLFHLPLVKRIKASFAHFPAKNAPNMELYKKPCAIDVRMLISE